MEGPPVEAAAKISVFIGRGLTNKLPAVKTAGKNYPWR